jgi:probable F420-dependent oxidoreductase
MTPSNPVSEALRKFSIWCESDSLPPYLAAAVEDAGFRRLWLGGPPASLANVEQILSQTSTLQVASGIVNIWSADARTVAASYRRLEDRYPGRFLLGIGAGHPEAAAEYTKPYEAISRYLDVLDAEGVPLEGRVLGSLGPRILKLAADRSAGAHPYLVPPAHTAQARAIVGPGKLLVPEHKVVLDADPDRARKIGRARVQNPYLGLVNYTTNLRRLGFTHDDLAGAGSDRLVDAVVAQGSAAAVAARLGEHLDAGADEVAVQLLTPDPNDDVRPYLIELAAALQRYVRHTGAGIRSTRSGL